MTARRRVLLGSTEPPAVGGSSTASLDLFRRLVADGWDAHYVHLITDVDAAYFQTKFDGGLGAPTADGRLHYLTVRDTPTAAESELASLVKTLDPDLLVGFGYLATDIFAGSAPEKRTVLVTGSCKQAQDYVTSGRVPDAVTLLTHLRAGTTRPRIVNGRERRAVQRCHLIITHSDQTLEFFQRFFPEAAGKTYPVALVFADWIAGGAAAWTHLARPFDQRDIDILFVSNDWDRSEKNYGLVLNIARQMPETRLHIVGAVPQDGPSATHHGFVADREAVFALMGRAKVVACPSLIDAAPGILYEAAALGCNLLASPNCGNWTICHPDLVADALDAGAFARCLRRALLRKYDDRLDAYLAREAYSEFTAVINAFLHPFAAMEFQWAT